MGGGFGDMVMFTFLGGLCAAYHMTAAEEGLWVWWCCDHGDEWQDLGWAVVVMMI